MDFHAAMETFAEAWVAANTQTAVNSDPSQPAATSTPVEELPTMVSKEQLVRQDTSPVEKSTAAAISKVRQSQPSPGGAKSLPIHCVVEQVSGVPSFDSGSCQNASMELDSYAILPSTTPLTDLVRTALTKLGYSASESMNAKGAIQLKKWKPLTFERITDNLQASVEDILGDLTNVATLKIRICSQPKLSSTEDVKEKLLQLLLNQSQGMLIETGCPIEKVMLSSITKGDLLNDLSEITRQEFDRWYKEQIKKSISALEKMAAPAKPTIATTTAGDTTTATTAKLPSSPTRSPASSVPLSSPNSSASLVPTTPVQTSGKHTRMRTSFDPEHEIPRLQKWFRVNQHPTREQMIQYLSELNTLDSRKGRKQLDLTNIIYWFKNARAAFRRASKSLDDAPEVDDGLCMAFSEIEEGNKDSVCEAVDESGNSPSHEAIPYLPNRNAVYVITNPLHRILLEEEATDLSTNRNKDDISACNNSQNPLSPKSEKEFDQSDCKQEMDSETTDTDSKKSSPPLRVNSRKRPRSDDGFESEDEENDPGQKSPNSGTPVVKQELEDDHEYVGAGSVVHDLSMMPPAAHNRLALSIPHMPHPLAMHYLPLNAQYYHAQLQQRGHLVQQQQQQANSCHSNGLHNNGLHSNSSSPASSNMSKAALDKKRRTRVFIDPLTEIPKLEQWFLEDTHPSAYMIDKYCEELNHSDYRKKYPRLEPKNVQLWFKNHRAKVKRMRIEGTGQDPSTYQYGESSPGHELEYEYDQSSLRPRGLGYEMEHGQNMHHQIMSA